ncbi:SDR family NAD(P)-dependent oxidoreductase [Devosia sp.]|uniref:SDR family NAD(P)-dependent oxidoreductase n=1 Tax=Devosia sp. TaxID=1871048 RepID=UPI001AD0A008|nr:SDR family NAD(P)-dependent oxidoreductase [Devosia sp.]MBN9310296.1 SDR family NAD(P)-dependent oxidoreductase [Devosia sp.]
MARDTVIVFGASRGLGEAIALALASDGFAVAALCRKADDAAAIAARIEANGGAALPLCGDVAAYGEIEAAVTTAAGWRRGLAGIVNNAGVIEPIAALGESDPSAWSRLIAVNLVGAYNCVRASLAHLAEGASIINISSGAASHPMEGWSAYCASKAGLAMMTRSIAHEYPGLRSYGLRPGVVDTDMQGQIRASGINRVSKLKREDLLHPSVPAAAVAWLLRHAPADLSGQEIDIRDDALRSRMDA